MKRNSALFLAAFLGLACALFAEEAVDLQMISRIKQEGFENSQVMDTLSHLTDVSGPRLTGSPGLKAASEWTRSKLEEWGLKEARLDPWGDFGRGWSLENFSMSMVQPYYTPLIALPRAWSPSLGSVSGTPILVNVENEADLEKYKGKLKDAIVMMPATREPETHFEADATRHDDARLQEIAQAPEPGAVRQRNRRRGEFRRMFDLRRKVSAFLKEEGAKVVLEPSRGEHGTLFVSGGRPPAEGEEDLPSVTVSSEHYAQLLRLLKLKVPLELQIELQTRFHNEDLKGYNVIAEIPGADPALREELVMVGGHIDSWHGGTGATDNASGVAVAMEAVRILKALNVQPRRTIRIGLWSGEEQGLLGSRAYVENNFAERKSMALKPAHDKFSAYYNLDNGTGKIRGIYLQSNDAVRPIFEAYLKPFNDLGAQTVSIRNTGGTDHLAFDAVGLPGFQFIQDPIDYSTRTHHTNMDVYDHALGSDLMQASVIMASFVYHTAMRDQKIPRKALPQAEPQEEEAPAAVASGGR